MYLELLRYGVNGVVATIAHYATLRLLIERFDVSSAGIANFGAALVGITVSFLGSRYFVFRKTDGSVLQQAARFSTLYGLIALAHGMVLLVWSDLMGFDYSIGFLIATALQVALSYTGNKFLVFAK